MADEQTTDTTVVETPSLMDAPVVVEGEKTEEVTTSEEEKTAVSEGEKTEEVTTSEEEKTEETKTEGDDQAIEYTDFTVPEGVELDTEVLDELKALGVDKKLSQEEAQSLVDLGVKLQQKNAQAFADAVVSARAEWRNAAIADPEFGGKDLSANMPIAVGARDKFGTPELKTLLDESGLGDHPEVIRFFYRVGKATGEHDFVKSGSGVTAPVSFYDHPTSKAK